MILLAPILLGALIILAVVLFGRDLIRSTPTVAQMVDEALDHGDAPTVVAGSDLDPLERLWRLPAYREGR